MKKTIAFVLLAVMLIALVGCTIAPKEVADNGKKAIMVVSFGTSYSDTRELTIEATEKRFVEAYPDYEMVRAFTSQIVIDVLEERDGIDVFNVEEAFEYLKENDYTTVMVQSLLILNGEENDEMLEMVEIQRENFYSVKVGDPLLTHLEDYEKVIEATTADFPVMDETEAVVYMGHGTHHPSNAAYSQLQNMYKEAGFENVYVGTVEGYPLIDSVIEQLKADGIEKVTLRPFMLVAGDHAENDMAGDEEDAWKVILKKEGFEVETYLHGLGENASIQEIFLSHAEAGLAK